MGPFETIPYRYYMQSPIGLVPKAGGKTRLIFHLSYHFKKSGNPSLNAVTPKNRCTVRYPDKDRALAMCLALDTIDDSCPIFFAKTCPKCFSCTAA